MSWESVRSHAEAGVRHQAGELHPCLLMPAELGGERHANNMVFVPPAALSEKDATTAALLALYRDGRIEQLSVTPEYCGESIVPTTLTITAGRDGQLPVYEHRIEVW